MYDRAIQVGLRLAGIEYESQKVVELKYRDHYVGEGYPDLLVHLGKQKIVVELKAVASAWPGQAGTERACGEFSREVARRMFERELVSEFVGRAAEDRSVARRV